MCSVSHLGFPFDKEERWDINLIKNKLSLPLELLMVGRAKWKGDLRGRGKLM